MDAYATLIQSFTPAPWVWTIDEPWDRLTDTRTIVFVSGQAEADDPITSSQGFDVNFLELSSPALAGLERLRTFGTWGDNWDAEGARAPDMSTLEAASKVFSLLAVHAVPQVALSSEGQPMFLFEDGVRGEVVITAPDELDYFFVGGGPSNEGVRFDGEHLPDELINHLSRSALQLLPA